MIEIIAVAAIFGSGGAPDQHQSEPGEERRICRTVEQTGTRMGGQRICKTARQWDFDSRDAKKFLTDRQSKDVIAIEPPKPPSPQ